MEIRNITADEVTAWRHCLLQAFAFDPAGDVQGDERLLALLDLSRAFGAFDRGQIVATAAGFDFDLAVPGGHMPMSGLTMVSVRATHRRRGILRRLIDEHLAAARRHGDPASGLWASEATIYGRFGYGVACESEVLSLDGARVEADGHELDAVEQVDDARAAAIVPGVYEAARAARPGMYGRNEAWWRYRRFVDRPDQRKSSTPRRYAVIFRDEAPTGYVAYRQKLAFDEHGAAGTFEIDELIALDPRAERTAWHYVTSVDLFPKVAWWNAPTDTTLPWLLTDRRRASRRRADAMWLRVDDVATTLGARRYAHDGELRLAVDGAGFRLTVQDGVARCEPTEGEAQVVFDRASLGSVYLGAFAPSQLARAGRVSGSAHGLALADRVFAWPVAPWCPEIF